jgi:hypothetical protein
MINCAKRNYHTLGNEVTMYSSTLSVVPNAKTKNANDILYFPHQWRSRARRILGRGRVRIFRREMLYNLVSIVPQPPDVRGGQAPLQGGAGFQGVLAAEHPLVGVRG